MSLLQDLYHHIDQAAIWEGERTLERKEYLIQAGQRERYLYYVMEGSIRVYLLQDGEEQVVRLGYPQNMITALDSFIHQQPTAFYIQALKKTRVRYVLRERYRELLHSSEELLQLWNQLLEGLILQQMEREEDLLITSPLERYRRVLQRSPQLFQHIPHKHIASYLRMTPETLSRIKKS